MTMLEQLRSWGACKEGMEFAELYTSWDELWAALDRADWMFWLLGKLKCPQREVSLACIAAIQPEVYPLLIDERSKAVFQVVPAYWRGEMGRDELEIAGAAWAAADAAAGAAARAAAWEAAGEAPWAARAAAWAAAWAAAGAAAGAAAAAKSGTGAGASSWARTTPGRARSRPAQTMANPSICFIGSPPSFPCSLSLCRNLATAHGRRRPQILFAHSLPGYFVRRMVRIFSALGFCCSASKALAALKSASG